jgi:hypothetical protein
MKTKLTLFVTVLAAALFGVGCASTPKGPPLPHAVYWNGGWYAYLPDDVNWHAAKKKCEELGGQLACIETEKENQFMAGLLIYRAKDTQAAWIGASDEEKASELKWVNGELIGNGFQNVWPGHGGAPGKTYLAMVARDHNGNPYPKHPYEHLSKWAACTSDLLTNPAHHFGHHGKGFLCEWNNAEPPSQQPDPDAVYWNGHWYRYFAGKLSWTEAKSAADKRNGHLVCIETEAENNFVTGLMMFANPEVNFCWIGYSVKKNGERVWVNGKLLSQGYKNLKTLKTEADRTGGVMQVRDYQGNPSSRHPYENLGKWWSAWDDFFTNPKTGHWEATSRPSTGYIVEWE